MKTKLSISIFLSLIFFFNQSIAQCPDATIDPVDPSICGAGKVITLTASAGDSYQWKKSSIPIKGATEQTYATKHDGTYTVDVTTDGCGTSTSGEATFVKHPYPKTDVAVQGNPTFCKGGSVLLEASVLFSSDPQYQWYFNNRKISGGTNSSVEGAKTGEYKVRVIDAEFGCLSFTQPIFLNSVALFAQIAPPITTTICRNSGSVDLEAFTNAGFFAEYQWTRNGVDIPGATDEIYTAVDRGVYRYTVNSILGCSATSTFVQIVTINCRIDGVNDIQDGISIYPNPASGVINISSEAETVSKIEIVDMLGKKILVDTYRNQLDISQFPNGMYFLKLLDDNNNQISISKIQKVQ